VFKPTPYYRLSNARRSATVIYFKVAESLVLLVIRMGAPIAADRFVFLVHRRSLGAVAVTFVGLPIPPDPDVLGGLAISVTSLIRLSGRLRLLSRRGLGLSGSSTRVTCERESEC
jgi:hypothetical protein